MVEEQDGNCIKDTGEKCYCVDCSEDRAELANRTAMNRNVQDAEGVYPYEDHKYGASL